MGTDKTTTPPALVNHNPTELSFRPRTAHPKLPVEVVERSDVVSRSFGRPTKRPMFHQLVVCTEGRGTHHLDFERLSIRKGSVLRIYPGQVQLFAQKTDLEASMVIWPHESNDVDPHAGDWYPGNTLLPNRWQLSDGTLERFVGWIDELRSEQGRYDASPSHGRLLKTLLAALLIRLELQAPHAATAAAPDLPPAYVDFRRLIEVRLYERPRVRDLAQELGYSPRTLDRACQAVSGKTAKVTLDERTLLEVRRLLVHTTQSIAQVGVALGFADPSNFTNYVKRHLHRSPIEIRNESWMAFRSP